MEERINLQADMETQRIPPPTTFTLTFKDIYYNVETNIMKDGKKVRKTIINKVSGYAKSGEVTAIMGPSGCGKTSLLNYLTDRIELANTSEIGGDAYVNSEKTSFNKIAQLSSYVMQDDLLMAVLTPRETLKFVAKLRKKRTEEEYELLVANLLEELKLTKCKDTRIGDENNKGISGGERKRVSIGVEIISNPAILFLDEPTSGLDSQTSFIVIDFMRELAKTKNMIIVFTIHQPSSNIFSLFDRLILLNKGQEVYQGPTLGVLDFFNSAGMSLEQKANPCDAFMHKMEEQNARIDQQGSQEEPITAYYTRMIQPQTEKEIETIINSGIPCEVRTKQVEPVGFWSEFVILTNRGFLNLVRNPLTLRLKVGMVFIFAFIACSIFYNMGNDPIGIYNKAGFFFFYTVNNFMTNIFNAVLAFPPERAVFLREYSGKLYGVAPYYLSKNVVDTPIVLFSSFLFSIIVYYIVGLRDDVTSYFVFNCIFLCLNWHAQSLGLCFGAAFSNLNTAMIITQFSVLPIFLFSGFIINQENMPGWLAWLRFFSPFRYAIEAGLRNEFDGNPVYEEMKIPSLVDQFNFDIGMWNCVGIMVAWGFGLRIIGGCLLKLLVRKTG